MKSLASKERSQTVAVLTALDFSRPLPTLPAGSVGRPREASQRDEKGKGRDDVGVAHTNLDR
jgi:hypothetical protein